MLDSINGIIGLAIGDAMGVPLEFCIREKLMENITTTMKGYGSHNVPKGSWSDDTSMTLATIDSIVQKEEVDIFDIANKFIMWMREAKYTPEGRVFDIGRTTLQALATCELNVENALNSGKTGEMDNGNGSLMRILPIAYYCFSKKYNNELILEIVRKVSAITHAHEISIMGCYIYVCYAIELLKGINKNKAYKNIKKLDYTMFSQDTINRYDRILNKNISKLKMNEISSQGYIVSTLEATFWVLLNTDSYNQSIIGAINLGNDTDTVGACTGGLAGILYGADTINQDWKNDLIKYDYIVNLCNEFNKVLNGGR